MKYQLFGNSGLRISELCLGTMTFGTAWGWGADKAESKKMFEAFAEAGGNFIDTANLYTEGESETFVGDFIKAERDNFVIATKYSLGNAESDPNAVGNGRKSMLASLDASLKRLNTDYVDVYYVHAYDGMTPVEEVMRGLDDLVRSGRVRYLAVSDTPAWLIAKMNTLAQLRGLTPFVGVQLEMSLLERSPEREFLPLAKHYGMSITPWGILASGILTGKYNTGESGRVPEGHARLNEKNLAIAAEVVSIAKTLEVTASQVAVSWLRQKSSHIVPILGARTLKQLQDNLASLDLVLSSEDMARLDKISEIDLGFPHKMILSEAVKQRLFGKAWATMKS